MDFDGVFHGVFYETRRNLSLGILGFFCWSHEFLGIWWWNHGFLGIWQQEKWVKLMWMGIVVYNPWNNMDNWWFFYGIFHNSRDWEMCSFGVFEHHVQHRSAIIVGDG
jgi:hypothetical protein